MARTAAATATAEDLASRMFKCMICLEEVNYCDGRRLGICAHRICVHCFVPYLSFVVERRQYPIPCPAPECRLPLDASECLAAVETAPAPTDLRLTDELARHVIAGTHPNGVIPCAHCDALIDVPQTSMAGDATKRDSSGVGGSKAVCAACRGATCTKCRRVWHEGNCTVFSDEALEALARRNRWKVCPSCKELVERSMGCSHMVCRCGFAFCYKCGGKYGACRCAPPSLRIPTRASRTQPAMHLLVPPRSRRNNYNDAPPVIPVTVTPEMRVLYQQRREAMASAQRAQQNNPVPRRRRIPPPEAILPPPPPAPQQEPPIPTIVPAREPALPPAPAPTPAPVRVRIHRTTAVLQRTENQQPIENRPHPPPPTRPILPLPTPNPNSTRTSPSTPSQRHTPNTTTPPRSGSSASDTGTVTPRSPAPAPASAPAPAAASTSPGHKCSRCRLRSAQVKLGICEHRLCRACAVDHLRVVVQNRAYPILCPNLQCGVALDTHECVLLVTGDVQNHLIDLAAAAAERQIGVQMFNCRHPTCNASYRVGSDATRVICPTCRRASCVPCGSRAHGNDPCAAAEDIVDEM